MIYFLLPKGVTVAIPWTLIKSALRQLDPEHAERLIAQLEVHFIEVGVFPKKDTDETP